MDSSDKGFVIIAAFIAITFIVSISLVIAYEINKNNKVADLLKSGIKKECIYNSLKDPNL